MSVLTVISDFCKRNALAVPSSVTGSTDTTIIQLFAVLIEVCEELVTESRFNVTTQEATFNLTLGVEAQGAMETLAPLGFQWAIFETFFNLTQRIPLSGPLDEREWQSLKALASSGTYYKFRIRNDNLQIWPIPTSTDQIRFEYVSAWYVKDGTTNIAKSRPTADNDYFVFPEVILKKGLSFYWKRTKGLPYNEDGKQYYSLLNNYILKNKVGRRINLAESEELSATHGSFAGNAIVGIPASDDPGDLAGLLG